MGTTHRGAILGLAAVAALVAVVVALPGGGAGPDHRTSPGVTAPGLAAAAAPAGAAAAGGPVGTAAPVTIPPLLRPPPTAVGRPPTSGTSGPGAPAVTDVDPTGATPERPSPTSPSGPSLSTAPDAHTTTPGVAGTPVPAGAGSGPARGPTTRTPPSVAPSPTHGPSQPPATHPATTSPPPSSVPRTTTSAAPPSTTGRPAPLPTTRPPPAPNFGIPVTVGNAGQLITVTASSSTATTGTLRAWQRRADGTWAVVIGPIIAQLGSAGIGPASEYVSRTPLGTFTLTEAFGRLANPGTALPYHQTGPNDWWVSDVRSAVYNTMQTCLKASCSFNTSVSEHLYYITPQYDYAVVMDVNRRPVVAGGGSAFFLHISTGVPTAGCVAIARSSLVAIMKWLAPAQHPRIATGIG